MWLYNVFKQTYHHELLLCEITANRQDFHDFCLITELPVLRQTPDFLL